MKIRCAEDIDDALILKMPEQGATIHDAVDILLEMGIREGFKKTSRKGEMHLGHILIRPEEAGDPIIRIENFAGLPRFFPKQVLEIAMGLVKIQGKRVMDDRHERSVLEKGRTHASRRCGAILYYDALDLNSNPNTGQQTLS